MMDEGRVVTANLPNELVSQLDVVAKRIDRSKSWIVRQAVSEWLAEEQRRYELTLEALQSVDEGRTFSHEEVLARSQQRKRERRPPSFTGRQSGRISVFNSRYSLSDSPAAQ